MKQVNLRIYKAILPLLMGLFFSLGAYAQLISVKGHVRRCRRTGDWSEHYSERHYQRYYYRF